MTEILDVIIIGGSFAGLSAAMTLGRAFVKTLIIDTGKPCNKMVLHSHNFITHDGENPLEIIEKAKKEVLNYLTVKFLNDKVIKGELIEKIFTLELKSGKKFIAKKLIFATGVTDIMIDIPGFKDCWGISILHCPYCHGYEVKDNKIGIIGNGEAGFDLSRLISNWTKNLILFTNGKSTLTQEQTNKIKNNNIEIIETEIKTIEHNNGYIKNIILTDARNINLQNIFTRVGFKQHCDIPKQLGCEYTQQGLIKVDMFGKTNVDGIYAAGDNTTLIRSLSIATASGTIAGGFVNNELIQARF